MAKAAAPSVIETSVGSFQANAIPDPFDARDLQYRPRLIPLPTRIDPREGSRPHIYKQEGSSCTGHAVATVVNTVLSQIHNNSDGSPRVSPYMLYRLARRYDEFEGDADEGSSLRGAFKGWFNHGVCGEEEWNALNQAPEPDMNDAGFRERCKEYPLGAFYRVNPFRLDDMQSAVSELNAICASATIHDGWAAPEHRTKGDRTYPIIVRRIDSQPLGGHAFAIVGYNEIGFLIQNSWGDEWGDGGFAVLPYEEWLDSAYDAWVARPGVPKTPFISGKTLEAVGTGGALVLAPGPNLDTLSKHVVNLGNNGRLSTNGAFVSSPRQIDGIFHHMALLHEAWQVEDPSIERHVVLYAHGGLNSERTGLEIAYKHLNWWLNNRVFPITFAWQTGPIETLVDEVEDRIKGLLPFGAAGFDLTEAIDRLCEKVCRSTLRWMWDEMKENARFASDPIDPTHVDWSFADGQAVNRMGDMPGAALTCSRLAKYIAEHPSKVRVHLAGHSAGCVFHSALLSRLVEAGIDVETAAFLAPAVRVDDFMADVFPHIGKEIKRFATFSLTDTRELDDFCGTDKLKPYNKSLLFLVSRAFERSGSSFEVPLLGMQRFFGLPIRADGTTLSAALDTVSAASIVAGATNAAGDDSRSDSWHHVDFDDDVDTMTAVVLRIRGKKHRQDVLPYQPFASLRPISTGASPSPPGDGPNGGEPALPVPAHANEPGSAPSLQSVQPTGCEANEAAESEESQEDSYDDMLDQEGWEKKE